MARSNTAVWRWSSRGRTGVWIECQSASEPFDWGVVWEMWATPATEEAVSPAEERKRWRSCSGKAPPVHADETEGSYAGDTARLGGGALYGRGASSRALFDEGGAFSGAGGKA